MLKPGFEIGFLGLKLFGCVVGIKVKQNITKIECVTREQFIYTFNL